MGAPESALSIAREAEALAAKATPGVWLAGQAREDGSAQVYAPNMGPCRVVVPVAESTEIDAAFIAFARTALPILARAVLEAAEHVEFLIDLDAHGRPQSCGACGTPNANCDGDCAAAHYVFGYMRKAREWLAAVKPPKEST